MIHASRRSPEPPVCVTEVPGCPDFLSLHALASERYPFLLESSASGTPLGRYDILFAFPQETLQLTAGLELTGPCSSADKGFLQALDDWWYELSTVGETDTGLPFSGGWFVFMGYELAQEIEPCLRLVTDPLLPVACATRIPVALVRDRVDQRTVIVTEAGYAVRAAEVLADIDRLAGRIPDDLSVRARDEVLEEPVREDPPAQFIAAVEQAKLHIAAGDIFQANLSRVWRTKLTKNTRPWQVYHRLRQANPAPFSGMALFGGTAVISSSPERLVSSRNGFVQTRPIAGTRARFGPEGQQEQRRSELLDHPKERAEHVMLIDLERNDLGRVCEPGTVEVSELMAVESYAHVHHIVSNVTGRIGPDIRPGQLLRAVFPGGTITGCPKVRCMEIIQQQEGRPRGAYTGSMGYLNRDGSCDFNILIRTMVAHGTELSLAAGSGIVADSEPAFELEETRAKAKGMLLALHG